MSRKLLQTITRVNVIHSNHLTPNDIYCLAVSYLLAKFMLKIEESSFFPPFFFLPSSHSFLPYFLSRKLSTLSVEHCNWIVSHFTIQLTVLYQTL